MVHDPNSSEPHQLECARTLCCEGMCSECVRDGRGKSLRMKTALVSGERSEHGGTSADDIGMGCLGSSASYAIL